MEIRKATPEDAAMIMRAYEDSTWAMLDKGIDQWDFEYPSMNHVNGDIKAETSFVIEVEGEVGVIVLDTNQSEEYASIEWHMEAEKALVIHRLAVHPNLQHKGVGKGLCTFAEEHAAEHGCDVIRLDAYSKNKISNNLYVRLGYTRAEGECFFHGNPTPFYCFEKRI